MARKPSAEKSKDSPFAVIETGGKQYLVREGDILKVEKISGKKTGDSVTIDKVLLTDNGQNTEVGDPYISGAKVECLIKEEGRGKKVEVVKYKAKSRYLKTRGHRQSFAKIEITKI